MVWVIVIAAIVVVAIVVGVLVARSRQRTQQIEQGREHREVAQRQEQEAAEREQAARTRCARRSSRSARPRLRLARAREEREAATGAAAEALDRSERQRVAAQTRHAQADEIEERVGPLDDEDALGRARRGRHGARDGLRQLIEQPAQVGVLLRVPAAEQLGEPLAAGGDEAVVVRPAEGGERDVAVAVRHEPALLEHRQAARQPLVLHRELGVQLRPRQRLALGDP